MKLRIREDFHSSVPEWLEPALVRLSRSSRPTDFFHVTDINNFRYTPLVIPRTSREFEANNKSINKDPNHTIVMEIGDATHVIVWIPGYFNDDVTIDWDNGKVKRLKNIADDIIFPYVFQYGVLSTMNNYEE